MLRIERASALQFPRVLALLREARLPTDDLADGSVERFLVATEHGNVVGAVALERAGDAALLRSLVVATGARGKSLGQQLVAAAEADARAVGVTRLVLLTTTAAAFFEHLGYVPLDRGAAPPGIRSSAEFAALCPATAVCLCKHL